MVLMVTRACLAHLAYQAKMVSQDLEDLQVHQVFADLQATQELLALREVTDQLVTQVNQGNRVKQVNEGLMVRLALWGFPDLPGFLGRMELLDWKAPEDCQVHQVTLVLSVLQDHQVRRAQMAFLAMKGRMARMVPRGSQASLGKQVTLALQGFPCPVLRALLDHQALRVNLHFLTLSKNLKAMSIIRRPS